MKEKRPLAPPILVTLGLKTRLTREEFLFETGVQYLQLWDLNSLEFKSAPMVYISGELPGFTWLPLLSLLIFSGANRRLPKHLLSLFSNNCPTSSSCSHGTASLSIAVSLFCTAPSLISWPAGNNKMCTADRVFLFHFPISWRLFRSNIHCQRHNYIKPCTGKWTASAATDGLSSLAITGARADKCMIHSECLVKAGHLLTRDRKSNLLTFYHMEIVKN